MNKEIKEEQKKEMEGEKLAPREHIEKKELAEELSMPQEKEGNKQEISGEKFEKDEKDEIIKEIEKVGSTDKVEVAEVIKSQDDHEIEGWSPKTQLGNLVKEGKIKDIDFILDRHLKIFEPEIVTALIPIKSDLLEIGQAKGKFGGGKRRAWKQTQRKTAEGNVPTFACMAVAGDGNGHVGLGYGKAKETLPAREKALRKAKLNIIKITRGCGSFDCNCNEPHSLLSKAKGKSGSVEVELIPAPQGTGLVIGDESKKILRLAGIKDIYSRVDGQGRNTINAAKAVMHALKKTQEIG